jgi:hypothetical protein
MSLETVAASLAARLGMTLQGDRTVDLLTATPEQRAHVGMTGSPYGRRAALSPFSWGRTDPPEVRRGTTHALWVATTSDLPDFEITLRRPPRELRPTTILEPDGFLAEVPIGDPALDRRFRLVTSLPRIASFLDPALGHLASEPFVHLFHSQRAPGLITSIADGAGLGPVLRRAEEHLYALELLACAVEGRALPARAVFA